MNLLLALRTLKMKVVILLTAVTLLLRGQKELLVIGFDPMIQSGDFGPVIQLMSERRQTKDEKYYLLKHHLFPSKGYNFPVHNFGDHNRRFQNIWLDEYSGLVYSTKDDGGYCKFCVLFTHCDASVQELGVLVEWPLKNLIKKKKKKQQKS